MYTNRCIYPDVVVHLRKTRNTLVKSTFKTPLGTVSCELNSNFTLTKLHISGSYENGIYERFKTCAHDIDLVEFQIKQPFYNGETITDSKCWICRIKRVKEISENLKLKVFITVFPKDAEFKFASGENLDAYDITNDK